MNHLVITGGAGGLGRVIVETFQSPLWDISAPGHGELDVSDHDAVKAYFDLRPVDLLVCAAGITRDAPLTRLDESAWDDVFAVNFRGAAACAAAALPQMIGQGRGQIIFISSHSALHPPVGQVAYATAKAALLGLTTALARENGRYGIRVNTILPGFLDTPMTENVSAKRRAEVMAGHTLGRLNAPAMVAGFIRYLHDHMAHTSGQVFQLDSRIS